jgi:hypothetical protein
MHTFPSSYTVNKLSLEVKDFYSLPFGCHICDKNVITGGELGKSSGNSSFALKNPPSKGVSLGPIIISLQENILSSSPNPTDTPSGGFLDISRAIVLMRV